jgi:hypothetical protein
VNGSDADFVKAYKAATGQDIDPLAVSQYRGYARTLAEQNIAAGKLNLESGQTNSLTGYLQAKNKGIQGYDWTTDAAAIKGLGEEYTRRTGKAFSMNDPEAVAWATDFAKTATVDPVQGALNDLNNQGWFKDLKMSDPALAKQLEETTGMLAGFRSRGLEPITDSTGKIVALKKPDGTLQWESTPGAADALDPAKIAMEKFKSDYKAKYPSKSVKVPFGGTVQAPSDEPFNQDSYDAIEESLGRTPTVEEYAQMAPGIRSAQAFATFTTKYSNENGGDTPDETVYQELSKSLGKPPTTAEYKKYSKLSNPSNVTTLSVAEVEGDPTAFAMVAQAAPKTPLVWTEWNDGDWDKGYKMETPPPANQFFMYNGYLVQRTGDRVDINRGGHDTAYYPAVAIAPDGTKKTVYLGVSQKGNAFMSYNKPDGYKNSRDTLVPDLSTPQ